MNNAIFKRQDQVDNHSFLVESECIGDIISITLVGDFIVIKSEDNSELGTDYNITLHAPEGWSYILHHACFGNTISEHNIASYRVFDGGVDIMDKDVISDLISILKRVGEYLPH